VLFLGLEVNVEFQISSERCCRLCDCNFKAVLPDYLYFLIFQISIKLLFLVNSGKGGKVLEICDLELETFININF